MCIKESVGEPSATFLRALATKCDGNVRRALLTLEAAKMGRCNFQGDGHDLPQPEWRVYIEEIAGDMITEQSPKRLHEIRGKFYDLMAQCIPADVILPELTTALLNRPQLPNEAKIKVAQFAAQFDHNLRLGSKPVMHLEAFVAAVMVVLRDLAGR